MTERGRGSTCGCENVAVIVTPASEAISKDPPAGMIQQKSEVWPILRFSREQAIDDPAKTVSAKFRAHFEDIHDTTKEDGLAGIISREPEKSDTNY